MGTSIIKARPTKFVHFWTYVRFCFYILFLLPNKSDFCWDTYLPHKIGRPLCTFPLQQKYGIMMGIYYDLDLVEK